jgi:hypothetical protein
MKAYEVTIGSRVRILDENVVTPPSSLLVNNSDVIRITGVDGAFCNAEDADGRRVYVAAWTEVELV